MRVQGYLVGDDIDEHDTITCSHCQRIVTIPPAKSGREVGYDYCHSCDAMICRECAGKRRCLPWEKQMEKIEARQAALRSYGF